MKPLIHETSANQSGQSTIDRINEMHTLIYRGTTYQIPKYPIKRSTIPRWQELSGKDLIYRGETYRIGRPKPSEGLPPKQTYRLIYRGETYFRSL
jgi:hypothetical protein